MCVKTVVYTYDQRGVSVMPDAVSSASTLERPVVLRQVEIPPTDPEHYITDLYALNVQAPEGTSGDWHDVFH